MLNSTHGPKQRQQMDNFNYKQNNDNREPTLDGQSTNGGGDEKPSKPDDDVTQIPDIAPAERA